MAASPADPLFGGVLLLGDARAGCAATDHAGVRHLFVPPADGARYALDVERRDVLLEPETASALRMAAPDMPPLQVWTRIEVVAKLSNRPAHVVLRALGRDGWPPQIEIRHPPSATHWLSIGRLDSPGPPAVPGAAMIVRDAAAPEPGSTW